MAIPLVIVIGIAAAGIKCWPLIRAKLGLGEPDPQPVITIPNEPQPGAGKLGDGFEWIDESNPDKRADAEPIVPEPETQLNPRSDAPPVLPADLVDPTDPLVAEPIAKPTAEPIPPKAPVEAVESRARKLLDQVFAAKTVADLAELVLAPERVRPLMESYYAGNPPDLTSTSIIYERSVQLPDSEFHNHTFFISTDKQPMRFPIAVEDTADGPKLDWETFIELHDDQLGEFLRSPQSGEKSFRVVLVRSHYFGSAIPKLGSKDCFRISTPIAGTEGYAFVEKDSKIARECQAFDWENVNFPVVTLAWTTPTNGGAPYLEIKAVVQDSWRAAGADKSN